MAHGAEIQTRMFEAVAQLGREGISELDLVAAAESVSRSEGSVAKFKCVVSHWNAIVVSSFLDEPEVYLRFLILQ